MFDALLTFVVVMCLASLASLGVLLVLSVAAGVEWRKDRRWRADYERELREAEARLSADVERWLWSEWSTR